MCSQIISVTRYVTVACFLISYYLQKFASNFLKREQLKQDKLLTSYKRALTRPSRPTWLITNLSLTGFVHILEKYGKSWNLI